VLRVKPSAQDSVQSLQPVLRSSDKPENYHTVTIELASAGDHTDVLLAQDNNESDEAKEKLSAQLGDDARLTQEVRGAMRARP
jgi:hypothetical protein